MIKGLGQFLLGFSNLRVDSSGKMNASANSYEGMSKGLCQFWTLFSIFTSKIGLELGPFSLEHGLVVQINVVGVL